MLLLSWAMWLLEIESYCIYFLCVISNLDQTYDKSLKIHRREERGTFMT